MPDRKSTVSERGEELNPQVTSSDPNERKLARRLRIARRYETLKKSKQTAQEVSAQPMDEEEEDEIQIQLKKSVELLEKLLLEGEEYITNVRVANDSREVDRRESEGINKEKVYEQLDEEAQSANDLFTDIANKWMSIQSHNDPLHINEAITEQKEKCDLLISQKETIIAMLKDELKNAEKQFTKDQKKQIEDINTLTQRIEKQISFMRRAYREELGILETVIVQERENLIRITNEKWESLYEKRQQQEISNSNNKFEQVETFNQRMGILRNEFQEHYRETKIKLENNIEELQRELEKIKALALLNSEKLDYNYQILKKREDENIIIKSQQKRRMNKLQDIINDLRRQISDDETTMSQKIKKLSDSIKKLHQSILDVEAKADHFAHVNDEKFHMIWEMNKNRILEVLRKICETDKVLYEQQMGLDWEPPPNFIIDKKTLPSYKLALNNLDPEFLYDVLMGPNNKTVKSKKSVIPEIQSGQMVVGQVDQRGILNYKKILKHILTRISDKSGFLAEKRLKELLKGYMDDQKHLVRLDNVFAALGIQGRAYIDILFKHFQPYTYCPVCHGSMEVPLSKQESHMYSSGSLVSSMFSKFGDGGVAELQITELDNLTDGIRQPDHILRAIISDLVDVDNIDKVEINQESTSEYGEIKDICGFDDGDQFIPKDKDKIKVVASRRKVSATQLTNLYACQFRHPLVISPVYVLKALKEFVSSYYIGRVGVPTTGARLEKKRMTISRLLSKSDIKSYWEKFKLNFTEDRVRVWDGLLEGLKKYHQILKDRRQICEEVLKFRKENAELKRLLANYLDHHAVMPPSCAKDKYWC